MGMQPWRLKAGVGGGVGARRGMLYAHVSCRGRAGGRAGGSMRGGINRWAGAGLKR